MRNPPSMIRAQGFTMLELVIYMILLTIIVGMVFGTVHTALALGNKTVATQNEEMELQAFFDLLSLRFSALPGNARLDLRREDSGPPYLSDLTLQNVPLSFTWGGEESIAKAVQLSTIKRRSGYLDIVLRYFENEILEDAESTFGQSTLDKEPFAEIVLLENLRYFEWYVLDGNSLEWMSDWEIPGRLPLQIELTMAIGAKGEDIRHVFWLPPKQNPSVVMRQTMQGGNPDAAAPGTPGTPGTPAINIPGQIPGVVPGRPSDGPPGLPPGTE